MHRGEDGFTLLELLVAMTITSLIGVLVLSGLKFGVSAWDRAESTNDNADTVEAVQRMLRRQMAAIYPLWNNQNPGAVVFDGQPESIEFVAPPPAQLGPGPENLFAINVSSGDLAIGWRPLGAAHEQSGPRSILLNHIQSVSFSYYGTDPNGQNPHWSDSWQGRTRLPQLIRLAIRFPPKDRRVWPEFTVHPDIIVDAGCIFDPISRWCRGRPQ